METRFRHCADLFERMAEELSACDNALRRAYFAEKHAKTGETARAYYKEAQEHKSNFIRARAEVQRLLTVLFTRNEEV